MGIDTLFVIGVMTWFGWGVFWLLPRKLKIFKRLGSHLTADQLIQKAKEGDIEIQRLVKDTKIFMIVGLTFFMVFGIIKYMVSK